MRLLPRSVDIGRFDHLEELVRRHFGFIPTPPQKLAAAALLEREIVELETGQGKTLTGALAAIELASTGRSVWICTANDYLAQRDADLMRTLFESRGLRVGVVADGTSQAERHREYRADVVYGTLREFGFDFLRSRLAERRGTPHLAALTNRDPFQSALIVDEADSLLIDEAVIPLVLALPADSDDATSHLLHWAAREADHYLAGTHFETRSAGRTIVLTHAGRDRLLTRPAPPECERLSQNDLIDAIERAILVNQRYLRDRHYVLRDDRVQIIDEFTGRTAEGRSWNAGIHQAIEAREGLPLTRETEPAARITVQEFVSRFRHVAGMTGTAAESAHEFHSVYGLRVRTVPPHQRARRTEWPAIVTPSLSSKWRAVADEAATLLRAGRAVLIGTRTVEASEHLSAELHQRGLEHVVLNARYPEREADIIAAAGQPGRITVATNMAGRGTDICLADPVRAAGGLHVVITELNASPRIDRQLIGRCGRQGDPGSWRTILSGEDAILTQAGANSVRGADLGALRRAQQSVDRQQFAARQLLRLTARGRERDMRTLGLDPILDPLDG
ncbi:preprotein translocase subunit SecA [Caulifigura coniformis]|uniref:Preprotein translocase subunit SecA n=1 Tax=Caulifigura coniformis TaxID=2527983 RepID=A0A517S7X3_9PLAN|nr:DEAD/DEAH box helicase [Caulifigura coniformis]QDT52214.1 preprotein translocase subunit SecA [Caulifigura coniformis]